MAEGPELVIVTTFNSTEWPRYARRMVETVAGMLPKEVMLAVVFEGERPHPMPEGVMQIGITEVVPDLPELLARDKAMPQRRGLIQGRYDYRFDAVRFCRKPLVCFGMRKRLPPHVPMVWLDADCVAHGRLDMTFWRRALPETCDISYLGRYTLYSECGFLGFNPTPLAHEVLHRWAYLYRGAGVFGLREWHDSWVFDQVRKTTHEKLVAHDLGYGSGARGTHIFINSLLGERLDHLKGPRKERGRSSLADLSRPRLEPYWREA